MYVMTINLKLFFLISARDGLSLGGHLWKELVRKGGFFSRNLLFKLDNVSEKRLLINAKGGGGQLCFPLNQFLYFFISLSVFILLKVHQLVIFSFH